jgi:hypothetical protein
MSRLEQLKSHLKAGEVYRRHDLAKYSRSVDRHLELLLQEGTLQKLSPGLYHYPRKTAFGDTPPEDDAVNSQFFKRSEVPGHIVQCLQQFKRRYNSVVQQ